MENKVNTQEWQAVISDGKFHVQLFHHLDSGKVVIKSNESEILKFNIDEIEEDFVSFFLGETICKIFFKFKNNTYLYDFKIDYNLPTALNIKKQAIEKENNRKTLYFIGIPLLILIVLSVVLFKKMKPETPAWVEDAGYTIGVVNVRSGDPGWPLNISYRYKVDTTTYIGWMKLPETKGGLIVADNGMPIFPEDNFWVHYSKREPNISRMLFNKPTEAQLVRYKIKLLQSVPTAYDAICLLDKLYEKKGMQAFAEFWFCDVDETINDKCNKNSFEKMMRSPEVENILKTCKLK
jgi:hypothetical protein